MSMETLTTELEGNADAVEFCTTPAHYDLLAAASYTLQEGPTPTRVGGLYLFKIDETEHELQKLQLIETSGIFDIKWRKPTCDLPPYLGQASADGSLRLYSLQEGDELTLQETSKLNLDSAMCLSLDWSPVVSAPQIAISHSDGTLSIIKIGQAEATVSLFGQAHELEAWTTSYNSFHPDLVYTGADDCHFCCWDLRQGLDSPTFRNRKTHQMGVCSIQTNPHLDNVLVTGSYDENLRLWDMRMAHSPVMKVELGLGGGVWRMKWHPFDQGLVLAACMHKGFSIVRVEGEKMEVVEDYNAHESLAYGADWYHGRWGSSNSVSVDEQCLKDSVDVNSCRHSALRTEGGELKGISRTAGLRSLVATCSFYDKALNVWEPLTLRNDTRIKTR